MKKIFKIIEELLLYGYFNDYRIIVTPRKVELKLTPKSDKDEEINWVIVNEKDKILDLFCELERYAYNDGRP